MADLIIKKGDTWPPLRATLQETNASNVVVPIVLTGVVNVKLIMKSGANFVEGVCTIKNATLGQIEYAWTAANTSAVGTYEVEFEIEYKASPLQVETVPNDGYRTIIIEQDLGDI